MGKLLIFWKMEKEQIKIPIDDFFLDGKLAIPEKPRGIVIFAHGSGSSRFSPRNQFVAEVLNKAHLATLLFDLLTEGEEEIDEISGELRFDIYLLADRLIKTTRWVHKITKN